MEGQFDRIAYSFKNHNVLVTGATGFMGKTFIEKILRSTEVAKIYLILRPKKGVEPKKRMLQIFEDPLFDLLKASRNITEVIDKIQIIEGDCSCKKLAISSEDIKIIADNVTLIYNFAASTRFDEPLKPAVDLNVRGTSELLKIANECKNLKLFCHISTAYCHLDEKHLFEISYPPPFDPHEVMNKVSQLDDKHDEQAETRKYLSPSIPNTYVLTKALAETLVDEAHKNKLPVMILRPSIVTPTLSEPVAGWMNSYNGLGGLLIAVGKGVLRDIHCNEQFHGDFVPVDVAIHALMMCTWNYLSEGCDRESYIVNLTSSNEIFLEWGEILKIGLKICIEKYPMVPMFWYPNISLTKYLWLHKIKSFFFHWLPAYFVDGFLFVIRVDPFLVKVHKRISSGVQTLEIFANTQWTFDNRNALKIRKELNQVEKSTYKLSSEGVNVDQYIENCVRGGHEYLIKRDAEKDYFIKGKNLVKFMYIVDKTVKGMFIAVLIYILFKIFS